MNHSFRRSITGRLVSLYALATFSILVLSAVFLCRMLSFHLAQEKERFLTDEIDALTALAKQHPHSIATLRDELEFEPGSKHFSHYWGRVVDAGRTVAETPGMATLLAESSFPQAEANTTHFRHQTGRDGSSYLLGAVAVGGLGQPTPRIIQLAIDTSDDEALSVTYRRDTAIVVLLGALVSTAVGWVIVVRGLAPLRDVAAHARRVGASRLHERLAATRWPDELVSLATAFDDMLLRLEGSFGRLARFSADLAHELRTPINNLMGQAEVALTRGRSGDEYREVLESNLEDLGQVAQVIDKLLFLARAENVETEITAVELDGARELATVREFYEALAQDLGVELTTTGNARLYADPLLFRRAIGNLVANALEHTPRGGHVTLVARDDGGGTEIEIRDDGCGIAPEHVPRLFERFYRVDRARRRSTGTGLGLAIVQSIADLHGGTVTIESAPGQGTMVTLCLPARPAQRALA